MLSTIKFFVISSKLLLPKGSPCVSCTAMFGKWEKPPDFSGIEMPENRKLRPMLKTPLYPAGIRPPKMTKRLADIRGPELVHNNFIHGQFGLVAITGGYLLPGHFEMIRLVINRKMNLKTMFAEWRVDAPWKPMTKKSHGKRMGGGKGNIHHYATPVKAGRIIFEMGGKVEYKEVIPLLEEVRQKMPVKSISVSKEMLEQFQAEEKRQEEENINPFTYKYIVDNNLLGCHQWISPYDFEYHGKYR
ncbi:mitochondrial ribosomal large subunit component [Chamberlinius hualienensis]